MTATQRINRRLAAIVAADVVGYSRLMGQDEAGTLARLKALRREIIDSCLRAHQGRLVKTTGDGLLMEFASAVAAVSCALDIQAHLAAREATVPEDQRLRLRIGINLGDVIHEKNDVFGDGVNVAARLEQMAEPGTVCVARNVFDQVRDRVALEHEYLGEQEVKNIARPVKAYRVRAGSGYAAAPLASPRRGRLTLAGGAAAVALALLAVALAFWPAERASAPSAGVSSAAVSADLPREAPRLSIAVLPFANLSTDSAQDYFADGITEDLITDLSRISGAFVIARNTSFTYKGKAVDVREVARELGVRYVLEGSVRRGEGRVRLNAQLIDGESGAHVWADRFDIEAAEAYALQDQVTGRIARALNIELKEDVSRRASRGRPDDLEAADLATQGWAILFNKPQTPDTNAEAQPLLERAVALDPRSAEAWTGLSYLHTRAGLFGWSPSRAESYRLGIEAGERAIALDPRSADAYYVLGFAVRMFGDHSRARLLFERCLELNPNYAPAYMWLGLLEAQEGRPEQVPKLIETAFRLSPRDGLAAVFHFALSVAHVLLGRDAAAIRSAREGIAANPRYPNNYLPLAAALAHQGALEEGRAALQRFFAMRPDRSIRDIMTAQGLTEEIVRGSYARYFDGLRKAGLSD